MAAEPPNIPSDEIGVIIVDHGSRREDSNQLHSELVALFARSTPFRIVEAAHMELAEPSLETAFDRCVGRGARLVVIHPYFLWPGRHWEQDIPALAEQAARRHAGVRYLVTSPLGIHPLLVQVISQRIQQCLDHAMGAAPDCVICAGTTRCHIQ